MVPGSEPLVMTHIGIPLNEVEDLLLDSVAYRQASRILLPNQRDVRGRPLTPLHGGHVGLLCTAGMLNGVFGDGEDRHIAHWRSVKFTDHWEEEQEDGTKILHDRERFSHELTLVFADVCGSSSAHRVYRYPRATTTLHVTGRTKVNLISCNFCPSAAYCFMDAESPRTKGPQPREGTQMEGLDLEHVIERARGHDPEALGEIYRQNVRRVFGLCRHMLDSRERAEDATSEVFVKLQRSIESYDGSIPFARWLLRVAGNQCIDVLRRQRRRRQLIVEGENENTVLEAPSREPSPLGAVLSKEERVRVRNAIAGLPDNFRLPLVLRYYSELSYDEIARELGLEKNNVATLIFRAKQELRGKLTRGSK
jgi:RNA polymerase sigma factor (sigma-70 family)